MSRQEAANATAGTVPAGKPYTGPTPYWTTGEWGPAVPLPSDLPPPTATDLEATNARLMKIEAKMRAHLSSMATFNEDARMIALRAFRAY